MDLPDVGVRRQRAAGAAPEAGSGANAVPAPLRPAGGSDLAALVAERVAAGDSVVIATAVRVIGDAPCAVGTKLVIVNGAPVAGTLGCSEFDSAALADGALVASTGVARLERYEHGDGSAEVFLEGHAAPPRLVVFGSNAVATVLLRWAPDLGYATMLVESRVERVTAEQRAVCATVVDRFDAASAPVVFDAVHVDHDAPDLGRDLAAALRHGARTVSLVASRRHAAQFVDTARDFGATDDEVARINTPAGLDLGGRSAPEIALSVLAGLVAARYGRSGGWLAAAPGAAPPAPAS